MTHILFESPLMLLIGVVLMLAVLATIWWFRPGRTTGWMAVGGMLLAVALLILQQVVVTDRERIRLLLDDIALAVDAERLAEVEAALADDCDIDGMDKQRILSELASAFEQSEFDEIKIVRADITVDGDAAAAVVRVHGRVRAPDWPYDYNLTSWEVQFVRSERGWLVHRAHHARDQGIDAQDLMHIVTQ